MSLIELESIEKNLLKEAINLRLKVIENGDSFYIKHIKDLKQIYAEIDEHFLDLKPLPRAQLIGCIRDLIIEPNEDFLSLTEETLKLGFNGNVDKIKFIVTGINVMNKLKRKKDKPMYLGFKGRLEKEIEKVN